MKPVGLVFAGGGGKGAYQIGIWRALRKLRLEQQIIAVSGTSVGALNAALYLKGNLKLAEQLWLGISNRSLLIPAVSAEDAFFSNAGLQQLLNAALSQPDRPSPPLCYAACKRLKDGLLRYFELRHIIHSDYRRQILLASSALPGVFPPISVDGELYVDGGANGDNVPVYPLVENGISDIIVIHLSAKDQASAPQFPSADIIDVFPSEDLGGFLSGTIDFSPEGSRRRMELGYQDGKRILSRFVSQLQAIEVPIISASNFPAQTDTKPLIEKKEEEIRQMEPIKFEQESIRKQYEVRLAQLTAIAKDTRTTTNILWDATAAKYAKTVKTVEKLLQQDELKNEVTPRITRQMAAFLEKCEKPEFHIALVGAIKAGKSSLINAILDDELASTQVTPETAALTKFRGNRTADRVTITFYSAHEWELLWKSAQDAGDSKFMEEFQALNAEQEKANWVDHAPVVVESENRDQLKVEIEKWTSSRSATHYFVKEVEVSLKDLPLPEGVILVDTPGLNDAVEYRSNITKDYIDRANAVFVCVKADRLSGQELATICGVFSNARYNPEKVYVIATQQDSLNDPVDDWKKQRAVWLNSLKEKACYGSLSLAEKNLISTSGYFYTLLRECESLGRDRRFQLGSTAMKFKYMPDEISEHYDELLDFTGIRQLKHRMDTEILEQYRRLLLEDIRNGYEQIKENITEVMQQVCQRQKEIIEMSNQGLEAAKQKAAEVQKQQQEMEQDTVELENLYQEIKKSTDEQKKQVTDAIRSLGGKKK